MVETVQARRLSLRRKLLYSFCVLAILFLIAELTLRCYTYATGRGFLDNPNTFGSHFFTNKCPPPPVIQGEEFNFYGTVVPRKKARGEMRILCLGGSTTRGFKINTSYPEQLQQMIDAESLAFPVTVLNAGADSYSTAHSLVNFSMRCLDTSPDVIIVYHNINDWTANLYGETVLPDYSNKYLQPGALAYTHRTGLYGMLMKVSRLARIVESDILRIRHPWEKNDDADDRQDGLVYFKRNLQNIIAIAHRHNIKVILASQPGRSDLREHPSFNLYNQAVSDVASEERVEFVDVAEAITDDELFRDWCHNTNEGVRQVAKEFLPHVLNVINP